MPDSSDPSATDVAIVRASPAGLVLAPIIRASRELEVMP
jgi:hypothetical protein